MTRQRPTKLTAEGGLVAKVQADDAPPVVMSSELAVAVEQSVRVQVGRSRPIETMDPAVRRHYHELGDRLETERRRQERDRMPVRPIPKGPRQVVGKDGKVVCWWCGNRPGEVETCGHCDSTGLQVPESDDVDAG